MMHIEQVPIPLRHFVYAGAGGLSDARSVKLEGTIGGGSTFGGWFSGDHSGGGTFYPEGPVVSPDDVEACLQRIANVVSMRGPGYLRIGHFDSRFAWALLANWSAAIQEATFRRVITVQIELLVPEACFIGPEVTVAGAGASGSLTITPDGSAPCWPTYALVAAAAQRSWVKVTYPNGSNIAVAVPVPSTRSVTGVVFGTDPRRRGVWANLDGMETSAVDSELTAWMQSQNTRGGGEIMPFMHATPAVNTIQWGTPAVDSSGNGIYVSYRPRWAF
jgi:hypothetical protein